MQAPVLVQRLVQAHGAQWVGLDDADAFTAVPGARVLFFCGDPVRFPEGLDVAVVLPELHAALGRSFAIGAVPADCEDLLARRLGVHQQVHFLGNVADLPERLAATQIVVLSPIGKACPWRWWKP